MRIPRRLGSSVLVASVLAFGAGEARAQDTRAALIEDARGQFSDSVALDLLMRAANPGLAAPDSLWAVSVFDMALVLLDQGREPLASAWLRWVARQGPQWSVDRSYFPPSVVDAYDRAVPAVESTGGAGDPAVATSWRWPDGFEGQAVGSIEVSAADPSVPLTVTVEGEGTVSGGGALSLDPGTYQMTATAQGYEPVQLSREVLPGVTTVLDFDLAPQLLPATEVTVGSSLVRIRANQAGGQVCTNGVVAGAGGVILTSRSALPATTGLEVVTSEGVFTGIAVAGTDEDLDLAVLRVGAPGLSALAAAGSVEDRQHVWSIFHQGCGEVETARTRLSGWPDRPEAAVPLSAGLPPAAVGSALVDRSGALVGLVTGSERVAPISLAERLLERAVADRVAASPQVSGGGGGPPWIWIGAGVAAAGVAAVVLGGGGGGENGNGNGNGETGSIRITFPGGQP